MRKRTLLLSILLLSSLSIVAETHLSEDIGGQTLNTGGSPYIVESDLTIPANSQVVVKPGTVILFKSFTGINVYGSILVEGTKDDPVVFTSINDANYNENAEQLPNSFDWNGIYVNEKAGDVKFRNFRLMYSVFGIKSQKDNITLQNGFFKQNGQFHFTIRDNIHYVQDNISYSYNADKDQAQADVDNKDDKPVTKGDRTTGKDTRRDDTKGKGSKSGKGRKVAAITFLGIGAATGISTVITGVVAINNRKIAEDPSQYEEGKDYDYYTDKFNTARTVSYITGATCGISLPVSLFLFIRRDKSKLEKKVTLLNIEGGEDHIGIGFTRRF